MKWFKHDSSAHIDAKLKKLKHKYGIIGYGLYWYCIELIALNIDAKNFSFELEEDAETIAIEWDLDQIKVQNIMIEMVRLGLFENHANGRITCLKLAKRLDDTNSRNPEIKTILSKLSDKNSEDSSENFGDLRPDKIRLDKNRKEITNVRHSADHMKFAEGMYKGILRVAEKTKKPDFVKWADVIRLMEETDKLSLSEMADVFRWANKDEFWKTNILSPAKFRKQFSVLQAKMKDEKSGGEDRGSEYQLKEFPED
jgi:hypothetical protein